MLVNNHVQHAFLESTSAEINCGIKCTPCTKNKLLNRV